jgi:PKD domain
VGRKQKQNFARCRQFPLIHPLEPRTLFASISNVFTDFFTGLRTVNVDGEGSDEIWRIDHNGNGRVVIDGPVDAIRLNVQQLNVRTNGGIDTVRYNLTADNVAAFNLDINTGDDNGANIAGTDDTVTINLNGNINRSLKINVQTKSFNDRITVSADHDNLTNGVRIASGRTLDLNLQTGDNNDTIDVSYLGDMDGHLKIFAAGDGGGGIFNGNDLISALVIMTGDSGHITGSGAIGSFDMKLEGNGGTDTFSARVADQSGGNVTFTQSLVTSGALLGSTVFPPEDKVTHTANVSVQGFQPDAAHDTTVVAPAFANRKITSPIRRGSAATLSGIITEPDPGDTFFLDVNWGDGTKTQTFTFAPGTFVSGQTLAEVTHRYKHVGKYHIRLTWRDQSGLSNTDNSLVVKVLPRLHPHKRDHHHKRDSQDD